MKTPEQVEVTRGEHLHAWHILINGGGAMTCSWSHHVSTGLCSKSGWQIITSEKLRGFLLPTTPQKPNK